MIAPSFDLAQSRILGSPLAEHEDQFSRMVASLGRSPGHEVLARRGAFRDLDVV